MFVVQALWFYLPILVANQCPGFAAKLGLPGNVPVSTRWLGANKTWAAYYAAALGAVLTIYLQAFSRVPHWLPLFNYKRSDLWLVGLAFGIGAVLGDHVESFVKRRIGKPPGAPWWPFDQLDYFVGALVLATPLTGWIGWDRVLALVVIILALAPLVNGLGYHLKLRKVPW